MNQILTKNIAVAAFFCIGLSTTSIAQSTAPINIVTTAVPFLRISPDARAGGMGDCGIAISPDANAGFWNLAKTPFATANNAVAVKKVGTGSGKFAAQVDKGTNRYWFSYPGYNEIAFYRAVR